jgi:hypothetical protein
MVLIGIKRELVAHLKHGMKCMSDKRYGTQWWRKPAQLQLKKYPLCAICLRKGQIVPARIANISCRIKKMRQRFGSVLFSRYVLHVIQALKQKRKDLVLVAK